MKYKNGDSSFLKLCLGMDLNQLLVTSPSKIFQICCLSFLICGRSCSGVCVEI
jgi:hypothetical protein